MNRSTNLFREIERLIQGGSLEKALNRLIEFSEEIIAEQRIVGSVFGSRKLDAFCQTIGAQCLKTFTSDLSQPKNENSRIIILVTELYRSGGHTAVIKDLINSYHGKGSQCTVIVADSFHTANHVEISSVLEETPVIFAPKGLGTAQRVIWLQKQILAESPQRIFLFGHMQDAVIVAAIQRELCDNVSFFHHSDHRFSLGVFLPHVQHVDFRSSGLENCRYNLGLENNWLLPLTSDDISGSATRDKFYSSGALRTCTAGSYKFDSPYAFSLSEDVIPDVIAATGGSHLHIGPLSPKNVEIIRAKLSERKIPQERFIVIELVKSLWCALAEFEVDVYIDSFPICGCRSVVEAMGAGIPVVVHENYKSRLLSNKDLVYEKAFSWREPTELYRYLLKLDAKQLKNQSLLARQHYELNHNPSLFAGALEKLDTVGSSPPVPKLPKAGWRDECLEIFEYDKDVEVLDANPKLSSIESIHSSHLSGALNVIMETSSDDVVDKTQLSKLLYATAIVKKGSQRSNLSEALLCAAELAYPDGATAITDKESISEFLFRFAVVLRDTDFDVSALHKLPTDLASLQVESKIKQ